MTDNTWILEEATIDELLEMLDEHNARLVYACREAPTNVDAAIDAVLSLNAIDKELWKRTLV